MPNPNKLWANRIEKYKDRVKKFGAKWDKYLKLYSGDFTGVENVAGDKMSFNIVFPNVNIMLGALNIRNPYVRVTARNKESEPKRPVAESALNYFWRELKLKKKNRRIVRDTSFFGFGVAKFGYHTEFSYGLNKDNGITEIDETIKDEFPWVKRWSPKNFSIAPGYETIEEAPWVLFRSFQELKEVKENKRYASFKKDFKGTYDAKDIETADPEGTKDSGGSKGDDEYDSRFCALYEIYDKRTNELIIYCDEFLDAPLYKAGNPYDCLDGFPCALLAFNDVPDKFDPIPDIKLYERQQIEINKFKTHILNALKRMNRKYGVDMTKIYKGTLKDIKSGDDGAIVKCKGAPLSIIQPLQETNVGADFWKLTADLKEDIRELTGVNEYMRGGIVPGYKSATEAAIIQSGSRLRSDDRIDMVTDFMSEEARILFQLLQNFADKKIMIKISGKGWTEFSKEDIKGEFDTIADVENALPMSKDIQRARAWESLAAANTLRNQAGNASIFNIKKLAEDAMRLDGKKNPEDYLIPDADDPPTPDEIKRVLNHLPPEILQAIKEHGQNPQQPPKTGGVPPPDQNVPPQGAGVPPIAENMGLA